MHPAHSQRARALAETFRQTVETEISPTQLAHRLEQGDEELTLLDVRAPEVYRKSHVTTAVNIPADELDHRLHEVDREHLVVVYCYDVTCRLSAQAGLELAEAGYPRVKELVGGFETFEAKYPDLVERFVHRATETPAR